jgi:hypothetical protein
MRNKCVLVLSAVLAVAASVEAAKKQASNVYASPKAARKAGPEFDVQGEYEGTVGGKDKIGVQVIALGQGAFQAMFLPGGLPGAGWDGKNKILCNGKLDGGKVVFKPAAGPRKYMGGPPDQFSATKKFPPRGQKDYTATISADTLTGKTDTGAAIEAKKVMRKSPTLCAKPPAGATVLLAFEPGKAPSLDAWTNQKWLPKPCGCVHVHGGGSRTKETFGGAWKLHVEFRTPFRPTARSQGRGNSGVYPPGGREIQVLDSFGLEGLPNECGGVYKSHACRVNMCLPPLSWQTYDITYTPPQPGKDGGKGEQATYHVVHNGVTIHEKVALGGGRKGPINLQDHGNPVSYRNIWIVKTNTK